MENTEKQGLLTAYAVKEQIAIPDELQKFITDLSANKDKVLLERIPQAKLIEAKLSTSKILDLWTDVASIFDNISAGDIVEAVQTISKLPELKIKGKKMSIFTSDEVKKLTEYMKIALENQRIAEQNKLIESLNSWVEKLKDNSAFTEAIESFANENKIESAAVADFAINILAKFSATKSASSGSKSKDYFVSILVTDKDGNEKINLSELGGGRKGEGSVKHGAEKVAELLGVKLTSGSKSALAYYKWMCGKLKNSEYQYTLRLTVKDKDGEIIETDECSSAQ